MIMKGSAILSHYFKKSNALTCSPHSFFSAVECTNTTKPSLVLD